LIACQWDHNRPTSYRYWLVVGTEAEIAQRLDDLWNKYGTEKAQLTNPQP